MHRRRNNPDRRRDDRRQLRARQFGLSRGRKSTPGSRNAADAVAEYFGRFPVAHARILSEAGGRTQEEYLTEPPGGIAGPRGAFTRISIGQLTSPEQLDGDWMMTHELTHMAFPDIAGEGREHHWMEEGMATYIEPIARAQIGQLTVDKVWGDMVRDMPQGLPRGRSGAGPNAHLGADLLGWRVVLAAGGRSDSRADAQPQRPAGCDARHSECRRTLDQEWPIERVLETGDKAVGCAVLEDLYDQMKATPVTPTSPALWRRLGVEVSGDTVSYDDQAPLATIRKAITAVQKSPTCRSSGR